MSTNPEAEHAEVIPAAIDQEIVDPVPAVVNEEQIIDHSEEKRTRNRPTLG